MYKFGSINFPSQTFDFSNLEDGKSIKLTGLYGVEDVNNRRYIQIIIELQNNVFDITYTDDENNVTVESTNLANINQDLDEKFDGDITGYGGITTTSTNSVLIYALKNAVSKADTNLIFLCLNESSKNTVDKNLNHIATLPIKYNRPIKYKALQIDVNTNGICKFNYVFLSVLERFYYVTDMVLTNDYASITLQEDVLMSFQDLIRSQTAFVERNEYNYDVDKDDNLVNYDYDKSITTSTITLTTNVFDVTLNTDYMFVISTVGG